jgi:hypothetical protein
MSEDPCGCKEIFCQECIIQYKNCPCGNFSKNGPSCEKCSKFINKVYTIDDRSTGYSICEYRCSDECSVVCGNYEDCKPCRDQRIAWQEKLRLLIKAFRTHTTKTCTCKDCEKIKSLSVNQSIKLLGLVGH